MTQASPAATPAHLTPQLRYLPGIDGLRALSVLAVLVYHHYKVGATTPGWLPGGFMGVEVFFVVSGYLITSLILEERRRTGTVSLREFWLRRARRLLPALFVLLGVVVAYALLFVGDAIEALKSDVLAALTYTSNWWQMFAERSYFESTARPPLLQHLWSLAIEEQFYLLWPLLLTFGLRRVPPLRLARTVVVVAVASALAMAVLYSASDPSGVYYATPTRLSGIMLGAALAFVWTPRRLTGPTGPGARVVLNVAGIFGMVVLVRAFRSMHDFDPAVFRGGFLLVDLATLVVVAATVHPRGDWNRVLGIRPLRWLGLRSYGVYLWHFPLFAVTQKDDLRTALGFVPPGFVWLGLRFGVTLLLAAASFRLVEAPIRSGAIGDFVERLRRARGRRRRRLVARGIAVAGATSLLAVALGGSLANARPDGPAVYGLDEATDEDAAGDAPDPAALAALRSSTTTAPRPTTTTAARGPTTTARPGATTTAPATTTTTAPPIPAVAVLGVGDSVMLGAKQELEATIPGMVVDAVVSRQFAHAIPVLETYLGYGALPPIVVVHLGTNGRWEGPEFDHMMSVIGPQRQVYFLTARMPRSWETEVNTKLAEGVSRHPNAHLLDWRQFAGCHHDWFGSDGFHVTDAGADNYARFVLLNITGQAESIQLCP